MKKHKSEIVVAVDITGRVLARRLRLGVDISFCALPATLEAAQRGLDILVLFPEDRVAEFIGGIESNNSRLEEKIAYETINAR